MRETQSGEETVLVLVVVFCGVLFFLSSCFLMCFLVFLCSCVFCGRREESGEGGKEGRGEEGAGRGGWRAGCVVVVVCVGVSVCVCVRSVRTEISLQMSCGPKGTEACMIFIFSINAQKSHVDQKRKDLLDSHFHIENHLSDCVCLLCWRVNGVCWCVAWVWCALDVCVQCELNMTRNLARTKRRKFASCPCSVKNPSIFNTST